MQGHMPLLCSRCLCMSYGWLCCYTGGRESSNSVLNERRKKLLYNIFFFICVRSVDSRCAFDTEFHYAALADWTGCVNWLTWSFCFCLPSSGTELVTNTYGQSREEKLLTPPLKDICRVPESPGKEGLQNITWHVEFSQLCELMSKENETPCFFCFLFFLSRLQDTRRHNLRDSPGNNQVKAEN